MGLLERLGSLAVNALASAIEAKGERPTTVVMRQPVLDSSSTWTPDGVRTALDLHERGDFSESALLVDAMGRDDRIRACLNTRINAITGANGLDFEILPPDGEGEELSKRVGDWWHDTMTDAAQRAILKDLVMCGVSVGRLHWELRAKEWLPKRYERWHLSNVYWSDALARFCVRHEGGEIVIEPGDPNWLVICADGESSWMSGAVRALGLTFVMRQWNWRDWARFNERHGLPIITVSEPAGIDATARKNFYANIRRMGSTGILRLPKNSDGVGFDADMLEAKDRGFESFDRFRDALNVAIAVLLLGQNLTTEVQGGSLAATTAHERVRADYLEADAETLATGERDGIIKPWGRFNIKSWDDKKAPWPTWACEPPEDRKSESETLKTFGEALTQMRANGVPVDVAALAERFNLPLVDGAQVPQFKEPEPAPPEPTPSNPPGEKKAPPQSAKRAPVAVASAEPRVDDVVDVEAEGPLSDWRSLTGENVGRLIQRMQSAKSYEEARAALDELAKDEGAELALGLVTASLARETFKLRGVGDATDDTSL